MEQCNPILMRYIKRPTRTRALFQMVATISYPFSICSGCGGYIQRQTLISDSPNSPMIELSEWNQGVAGCRGQGTFYASGPAVGRINDQWHFQGRLYGKCCCCTLDNGWSAISFRGNACHVCRGVNSRIEKAWTFLRGAPRSAFGWLSAVPRDVLEKIIARLMDTPIRPKRRTVREFPLRLYASASTVLYSE